MIWNYSRFDFGQSYFRDISVLKLIGEKLPVSISLGIWMTLLSYLISIPLGIRKAVKDGTHVRRVDLRRHRRRLCGAGLPLRHLPDRLLRRRHVLRLVPAARARPRTTGRSFSWPARILDYFWHLTLPLISMALAAFATTTLLTKNSFLDEIRKQYVVTARSKGLIGAAGALRPRLPQRHAARHLRLSRRLHLRLLRRLAPDRDDLLARRARAPRLRERDEPRLRRSSSPRSTSSR